MLRCDSILNHAFKICEGGVFHVSTQWRWLNDHHIQSSIGGGSAGQTCHENIIPLGARCPMPRELSEGCPPRHSVRDSARTRTGLGRFTKWSWTNVALSHRWLKLGWNRSRLPTPAFCSSDGSEPLTYLHGSANNFGLSAETAFLQPYTWNVSQYLRESLASSLSALLNLEGYRNCPSNRVQELGPNLRMIMVHRTVLQQQQLNNMWCDGSVTKEPQFVILVSQFSNYTWRKWESELEYGFKMLSITRFWEIVWATTTTTALEIYHSLTMSQCPTQFTIPKSPQHTNPSNSRKTSSLALSVGRARAPTKAIFSHVDRPCWRLLWLTSYCGSRAFVQSKILPWDSEK